MGAELFCTYWLAILAKSCFKVGKTEKAISIIAEALETSKNNSELYYQAELYRLKGEFLLQKAEGGRRKPKLNHASPTFPAIKEVESCFRQAIEVAHQQNAKSLELRGVMSMCRLLQKRGRKQEAQQMLAKIYGCFTEGFDTEDLKGAKALLEELSG
jgi:tetratricopeptide (TPR) repeat protein